MKHNVGKTDRIIRFVIGGGLLIWAFFAHSWLLAIIGVVLLATAFMQFCGLYKMFGMNTCPLEKTPHTQPEEK